MNDLKLDKYLNIANEEKMKRGLGEAYAPLYPMFRLVNEKLYVGIMLSSLDENVWDANERIKPGYWMLIDPESLKVVEFNKTNEKDFVVGKLIQKNNENKQKEISKYIVNKTLQYKNYLKEDIKNDKLLLVQQKVSDMLNNVVKVNDEEIDINDYLIANIESDIDKKVNELVDLLVQTKYGTITFYYDILFDSVTQEYINHESINKDKMKLCIEIMNNYYDGVIGIDNFFNI